jgi:hypothetical protein
MKAPDSRQFSILSILVGPAQYPIVGSIVFCLSWLGLWETHTWKELTGIFMYVFGAFVSICLAIVAIAKRTPQESWLWPVIALVLSLANLLPTWIVLGGW